MSETKPEEKDASGDAVESAGETTAADTIEGPTDERPVGEETEVKSIDE